VGLQLQSGTQGAGFEVGATEDALAMRTEWSQSLRGWQWAFLGQVHFFHLAENARPAGQGILTEAPLAHS